MRLPKTLNVAGKTYTVCRDHKLHGGHGNTGPNTITVGTAGTDEDTFENLIHEVAECTAVERGFRFSENDASTRHKFVMDHNEFGILMSDIANSIFPLLRST